MHSVHLFEEITIVIMIALFLMPRKVIRQGARWWPSEPAAAANLLGLHPSFDTHELLKK